MASAVVDGDVQSVLVSGASGFIASHVVQLLLRSGYRVKGTVRSLKNETKVQHLQNLCPDSRYKLELVEADLTDPESWKPAVAGCSHVIHIASPFPNAVPKDENELIKPAVEGTLSILKACQEAATVKRVVMTSSIAAISGGLDCDPNAVYSEKDWPDVDAVTPYEKSKVLAEKAAWDFVENLKEDEKFELAVVNPGYVMGPVLGGTYCTSAVLPVRMLQHDMPGLPKLNFPVVDVRDVALAHVKAMTLPQAAGNRHVLVNGNMWVKEMALILQGEFKSQGYNIPSWVVPKIGIQIYALFDKPSQLILPGIGKIARFDNTRMKEVLGIEPRNLNETLIDMSYSLIEGGFVKKTSKYRGVQTGDVKPTTENIQKKDETTEKAAVDGAPVKVENGGDGTDVKVSNENEQNVVTDVEQAESTKQDIPESKN